MIKIKKYFFSFSIVILLLLLGWYLALELTKQRMQLEAGNRIKNFEYKQTPFIWDFEYNSASIVKPTQKYWQQSSPGGQIKARKSRNSKLSLNFSGEVVNNFIHKQLVIRSISNLTGTVTIQVKESLESDVFYYSPEIKLNGKEQIINLQQNWQGINRKTQQETHTEWGTQLQHISSIVLSFNHPDSELLIDDISLPYNNIEVNIGNYEIDCRGSIVNQGKPDPEHINKFKLIENCYTSSNYFWLKQYIHHHFPESILMPYSVKNWQPYTVHKINHNYSNIFLINFVLYSYIIMSTVIISLLAFIFRQPTQKQEKTKKWKLKRLFYFGLKRSITPYHLTINYAFILIPTLLVFVILILIKFPSLIIFKSLPVYFIWALLQQIVLGYLLADKLFYRITKNRTLASLFAGFIFSMLHMPSIVLMMVTFLAGTFWAYSWLVFKRLIPLALSHCLLAITFYYVISERLLHSAKVFHWFWM